MTSLAFGIPSYNEGSGIVHTLESLGRAVERLSLADCLLIVSDSSDTTETVDAVREWARKAPLRVDVDRSETRRSSKEARNVIMERARSELLLQLDADVLLPTVSLYHLLLCLTQVPFPAVATGSTAPDPSFGTREYKASAWQLKAARRYVSWLSADEVRAEAAFWGSRRAFYRDYRFPVGSGSAVDDVDLALHLRDNDIPTRNCWKAFVYKVPAGTLDDFFLQTHRGYAALGARRRTLKELGAALVEAATDPIGAGLYVRARIWAARKQRATRQAWVERWEVEQSTKRR
jgi:glycosyltransferase involved in cell wall biosynthesis